MSAKILVVDDEPDLEGLILQKFRRQIRDGTVSFLFAHDGIEALTMLDQREGLRSETSNSTLRGRAA
jgi:adenylate cyclase